jgi:DNA mismatch repair ATPase MutS
MSDPKFELDRQTLADLSIFSNFAGDVSVLSLFDRAKTIGGKDKLSEIFKHPLTNREQIAQRIECIRYLGNTDAGFSFNRDECDYIEFYLNQQPKPVSFSKIKAIEKKALYFFNGDNAYYVVIRGVENTLHLLKMLDDFIRTADFDELPKLLRDFHSAIMDTMDDPDFIFIQGLFIKKKLSAVDIAKADHLFRYLGYERLKALLDIVYQLDVFTSVGMMAKSKGFSFPVINKTGEQILKLQAVFHPFIKDAITNDVAFNHDKNVCFITGANMAGKSTLLKAIAISVFLSQLGFPVPAAYMETSAFEGLITTINLTDNILSGNSHFYSEVSRVKHVATQMSSTQNMLVIFDELFRGTNVKDAYDASLAIIAAFSKLRKSFFIISTHIVEVAHELASIENINFKYLETIFDNETPTYNFQLKDGITEERLGMWIVKNEGIVEIIEGIVGRESD